jgi:hypothetical protein
MERLGLGWVYNIVSRLGDAPIVVLYDRNGGQ